MAHRQILEVACVASATARPLHRLGQIAAAGTVQPSNLTGCRKIPSRVSQLTGLLAFRFVGPAFGVVGGLEGEFFEFGE
ncbi:MAG: hypothetical protein ABSG43_30480, partial [Solirubrobacteraceae bacterium]